ncbi:MAG: Clp protease ClpP [Clostridiales bacterium]|nr:Clp protease ClpP [Clostridiales bacterium]
MDKENPTNRAIPKKFWNWAESRCANEADNSAPLPEESPPGESAPAPTQRTLYLYGAIAEDGWYDDDVTPELFREELYSGSGDIIVRINSCGGDCIAAALIYNMLRDYPAKVTVYIDALAASAASVIAMAGDTVLISPLGLIMIHNPLTIAAGDHNELTKAASMLEEIKDSIIESYVLKTGLSRSKLSRMMENETWLSAEKCIELGFADGLIERVPIPDVTPQNTLYSQRTAANRLMNKLTEQSSQAAPSSPTTPAVTTTAQPKRTVSDILRHLDTIKKFI